MAMMAWWSDEIMEWRLDLTGLISAMPHRCVASRLLQFGKNK
jgi:hypothetical protein